MRKAKWVAAATGVVLLVAGCGSEGDADKGKGGEAPASGAATPAKQGSGTLDAAAVKEEIAGAATGAGFTEKSGDDVPASHQGKAGSLLVISFIAADNGPTCAKAFQEDLAENKR